MPPQFGTEVLGLIKYFVFRACPEERRKQFEFAGGGSSRVGNNAALKRHWYEDAGLQNITVPKNGYIFVYVSNESNLGCLSREQSDSGCSLIIYK